MENNQETVIKKGFKEITAQTFVGEFGLFAKSFELTFEEGIDLSSLNMDSFSFRETTKHPNRQIESFGAYSVKVSGQKAQITVDPFILTDKFTVSVSLDGEEKAAFNMAAVDSKTIDVVDDFEKHTTENGLNYRLFRPETDQKLPLVVTFHGSGERGTDNEKHMTSNRITTKWGDPLSQLKYPCVVLGPQSKEMWSEEELDEVRKVIDGLIEDGTADENRIYAAGIAAGEATLRFCVKNADLIAAALPMIYWEKYDPDSFEPLAKMPLWLSIGENDFTKEAPKMEALYHYLKDEMGNEDVHYTPWSDTDLAAFGLYGGLTHWAWVATLNTKEMTDWLFSHSK